jgi:hypothetical protein
VTAFSDVELSSSAWGSDITWRWKLFFPSEVSGASSWWKRMVGKGPAARIMFTKLVVFFRLLG